MSLPYLQNNWGLSNGLQTMNASAGGSVGGWVELARGTGSSIDITSIADKRYYMILSMPIINTTSPIPAWRFNSDTGSNYAERYSGDGAADATRTSQARFFTDTAPSGTHWFNVQYISNLAGKEKLVQTWMASNRVGTGAANAPSRMEHTAKWANTTNAIDEVEMININSGSLATTSEMVVLGWDPADTHTTNFWTELASVDQSTGAATLSSGTITAKKYLWIQCFSQNASSANTSVQLNNDTSGNYANRYSIDGGADTTAGSQIIAWTKLNSNTFPCFTNMFIINNSANEKLMFGHTVTQNTAGAGTAPKRDEFANKWVNTSAQITEIDFLAASGNITGNLRVWGSD